MVTLNTTWPGFHLPGMAGVQQGEVEALGSCLGEPCPVLCQHLQHLAQHRLVVQDRRALRCCEFGQHRWPGGLCLLAV